jgi:hypothetical protein
MGVPPLLGREFTPADVTGGNANPVAVLSYLFWKKQYGGRLDVLGKTLQLDHVSYTVIGVASPRFTWGDSDVYIPGNFTDLSLIPASCTLLLPLFPALTRYSQPALRAP